MSRLSRFIHFYTDEDDGNGGEKGVLKTVSGTIIHILDALAKPAKKFVATLEPIQDLHGQDAPYPAGGGKNKFDLEAVTVGYAITANGTITPMGVDDYCYSDLIPVTAGQTYTYSGKCASPTGQTHNNKRVHAYADGTWQEQITFQDVNVGQNFAITFTVPSGANGIRISAFTQDLNVQIEQGSYATGYAPYSNECPITGHTGANVVRTGKNLMPPEKYAQNANTVYLGGSTSDTAKLKLKSGTYTIKAKYPTNVSVYIKTAIRDVRIGTTNLDHSFTLDESETELQIYVYSSGGITPSNISAYLEVGNVTTSEEEYSGNVYSITFSDAAGTVYGGTLTDEDGEWKLRVTNGIRVYDGSSDESFGNYSSGYDGFAVTINDANINGIPKNQLLSNVFVGADGRGAVIQAGCVLKTYNQASDNKYVFFCGTGETTVDGLRTWLSNNPTQLVYPLATPIEYTLTESQALTLLSGENNIWADASDDLELTYYADGNVSTLEALNTLLGGRYTNLGTPDDVPDREALQIILGETT